MNEQFKKYNEIWDYWDTKSAAVSFDREPVSSEKYLKSEIKTYDGKMEIFMIIKSQKRILIVLVSQ